MNLLKKIFGKKEQKSLVKDLMHASVEEYKITEEKMRCLENKIQYLADMLTCYREFYMYSSEEHKKEALSKLNESCQHLIKHFIQHLRTMDDNGVKNLLILESVDDLIGLLSECSPQDAHLRHLIEQSIDQYFVKTIPDYAKYRILLQTD